VTLLQWVFLCLVLVWRSTALLLRLLLLRLLLLLYCLCLAVHKVHMAPPKQQPHAPPP
jgi:hypothetical protein